MSKVQKLRSLVNQRLTAAVEEIFGLFERTIAEYEEEVSRSKQENERQRKLLDAVLHPEVRLHRVDVQQLLVSREEVTPEQQEWSPSPEQEEPEPSAVLPQQLLVSREEVPPEQQEWRPSLEQEEPEPPHIKEEQEEVWSSREGEQLQGLEEVDITEFLFTLVPVKSEDDEEKAQSSQLHQSQSEENREAEPLASSSTEQMETEADGEDCGGSQPDRNLDPAIDLQPTSDGQLLSSHSSEAETEDGEDDSGETRGPQSGSDSQNEILESHKSSKVEKKPLSCSVCGETFQHKTNLRKHSKVHREFLCSECGKDFGFKQDLQRHMRVHTGERPFSCSVCDKTFTQSGGMRAHMKLHTGEKPFCCSVCGKAFPKRGQLTRHIIVHTGEKPHSCSVCGKKFSMKYLVNNHMKSHTGEKPYRCSVCGKGFTRQLTVRLHKCRGPSSGHTEKPPECTVCGKSFSEKYYLNKHMRIHTGEKPLSCTVCRKRFTWNAQLRNHECPGESSSK